SAALSPRPLGRGRLPAPRSPEPLADADRDRSGEAEHVLLLVDRAQCDAVAARVQPVAVDAQLPAQPQAALGMPAERDAPDLLEVLARHALHEDADALAMPQPGDDRRDVVLDLHLQPAPREDHAVRAFGGRLVGEP